MASASSISRTASKSNCPEATFFGATFYVPCLRKRDAARLQPLFGSSAHRRGRHLAQAFPHAIPDGRLSCSRNLLADNLMHDCREQVVLVHFPAHNAHRINRSAELFVFRLEIIDGIGAIFEIARQRERLLATCGIRNRKREAAIVLLSGAFRVSIGPLIESFIGTHGENRN